jgi:hypothetical protein
LVESVWSQPANSAAHPTSHAINVRLDVIVFVAPSVGETVIRPQRVNSQWYAGKYARGKLHPEETFAATTRRSAKYENQKKILRVSRAGVNGIALPAITNVRTLITPAATL